MSVYEMRDGKLEQVLGIVNENPPSSLMDEIESFTVKHRRQRVHVARDKDGWKASRDVGFAAGIPAFNNAFDALAWGKTKVDESIAYRERTDGYNEERNILCESIVGGHTYEAVADANYVRCKHCGVRAYD